MADPSQLEQLLMNLAVNVRDAMPEAGRLTFVTDDVELAGAQATELQVPPGRYVRLTVQDTGCGMAAEVDLLLTDVVMPKMGGFELARILLADRTDLRIIFISGYSEEAVLDQSAFGDASFVENSIRPNALLDLVHQALHRGSEPQVHSREPGGNGAGDTME